MPATSISAGASRRGPALALCSQEALLLQRHYIVFLNIFDIFYVSSKRSDDFHARRQMSLVGSILAEVQLYSTPLEPPCVEPSDDS